MYLLIQNNGVAPLEGFTVLGVSTSRGNSEKIGQFGSGLKHGINLLMRNGINPIIYLGEDELKFYPKVKFMGEKQYNRICYSFRGEEHETGFALEFGEIDWDSTEMVLREIISNAIDASGKENVVIDTVSESGVRGHEDFTSIYIPLTQDIQKYYLNLSNKFLHFVNREHEKILTKDKPNDPISIYRKGVFVRNVEHIHNRSVFNYNFDDSSKIDESRNMQDGSCAVYAAGLLARDIDNYAKYFEDLSNHYTPAWEDDFVYWLFDRNKAKEAWEKAHGNAIACPRLELSLGERAQSKGFNVVYVRSASNLPKSIPTVFDNLNKIEKSGYTINDPTMEMVKNLNKVWRKIETVGLTNEKPKPKIFSFTGVSTNGSTLRGYQDGDSIYINVDDQGSHQTILEECAHYITGASDMSRDFQEFAFNFACRLVPSWNATERV